MGSPESWIICHDCGAVMSTKSAVKYDIEYDGKILSADTFLCTLCDIHQDLLQESDSITSDGGNQ